jgi:hypothetical protein
MGTASVAACMGALALSGHATAATTIGETVPTAPPDPCGNTTADPAFGVQTASAGNSYTVPAGGGVITRWRTSADVTNFAFALYTTSGGNFTRVAEDPRTVDGTLHQFDVRIPVQGGEILGSTLGPDTPPGSGCFIDTANAGDIITVGPAQPIGTPATPAASQAGVRFNIAADVEPDADRDGYGDETQDGCPADATKHVACDPPDTTITKGPKAKISKSKVKYKFTSDEPGSTFECSLKGKGLDPAVKHFTACSAPRKYKHLKVGKYRFKVRAIDKDGNADPTPAKDKFKVVG